MLLFMLVPVAFVVLSFAFGYESKATAAARKAREDATWAAKMGW